MTSSDSEHYERGTSEWTLTEIGNGKRTFHVNSGSSVVGRGRTADLRVEDASVSKSHARITTQDGKLLVQDLGSTNGTMINGELIKNSLAFDGDLFQIANVVFRVGGVHMEDISSTITQITDNSVQRLLNFEQLMSERKIIPYFQPIVAMKSSRTQAFEMLARSKMQHLETPIEMFATAEQVGHHVALSELMREVGAKAAWESKRHKSRFYFNIHPQEFGTFRLNESLTRIRESYPELKITVEVHEGAIANTIGMKQFQTTLNHLDMQLSYDDFGAGQGRLLELTEVPPDVLKFDMQLIRDIDEAPASRQELVRSLVKIASDIGTVTLAEGIETEAEHDVCQELGFKLAQGHFYGRAEPLV